MTRNKSVGRSNALQETATDCSYVGLQAVISHVDGRTVRKQVHHVEYYWELRSKNAQNIKALMCPLYKMPPFKKEAWIGSRELTRKA